MRFLRRRDRGEMSFSARMPKAAVGVFAAGSICAVKLSVDPFSDFRKSISEVIAAAKVFDWDDVEELVYCYVALNPPELRGVIGAAFLSLSS